MYEKKKLLIHTIAFAPDGVSTAYIYNDLAKGFHNNNFEVTVLTSTPHYNLIDTFKAKKYCFGLFYISTFNGIKVIHVPLKKHESIIIRFIFFIKWHLVSFMLSLFIRKVDFILSPSPPLTIGIISILIGKLKKAKVIYNVQEVYPDLLINQGGLKSKFIISLLKKIEKIVYKYSDSIVTIHEQFYTQIKGRIQNDHKIKIIPNFVDTSLYKPIQSNSNLPLEFIKYKNKFTVIYAGNIGYFQDWEPVFYAAKKLKNLNLVFVIIGEGVKKSYLENRINNENITNIKVHAYQNRDRMPAIINFGDVHFITIEKKLENEGFPSKVYTIMACGKPLIVISGKNSPIYKFLYPKNCSILITEDKNENFYKSIIKLYNEDILKQELGNNGYFEIIQNFNKDLIVDKYIKLFNDL